jgi:uncharacterized RDD family membrane protein YckC
MAKRKQAPPPPPPPQEEVPVRLVAVAYLLALVCVVAPLAILGAGFAGAVLFTRGRRPEGAGVIVLAVACAVLGATVVR